ncbi:hypothetical protein [Agromyces aerolatus]|uniref:hypothetical protein n=1 Tax=Agromyces sp. LY-1074 TaxID=3074080 RepID=UPI00285EEFC2|nr:MULTISPECIES: hypothetical protein [unclassified Agromyces]MDR5699955.1 hypothetical protein [Agromyces sp. LY-1074]MDR5706233.1 hypothetical protein [Agromyces sp. LY-1358]
MSRPSQIQTHEQRDAIERALIAGRPVSQISAQFSVSRESLYRHTNAHLAPTLREQLRGENRHRTSRLVQRLADIADDHAHARESLRAAGHLAGAVRAGDAETRAIAVLLDRLGIDDLAILDLLNDGDSLARAAGRLARSNPEAGRQLVAHLHDLGAHALADALSQTMNTTVKELNTHGN